MARHRITAMRVIEELSRQDGSVGWNVMVASNTATIASYLPSDGLQTLYQGGANTVVVGALLPKGEAYPVPRGYRRMPPSPGLQTRLARRGSNGCCLGKGRLKVY